MTTIGPYHLDTPIGRGSTGTVWRATRPGSVPQAVALKLASLGPDPGARDRLRREAAVLAELDHPHIVGILDVLDHGDQVAVVMPLARGGSLHDLLEERGPLTAGEAVAVLAPVAEALGSAHRRGLVHGDVKPANILFTVDGEPLLGDFGVAQPLRPPADAPVDEGGDRPVGGSAGYVDPELLASGRAEPGNDIYGVAVVAYLCLTGRLPHLGATDDEALAAADAGDHPSLGDDPAVPRALAEVVEGALVRDPSRRPATATALARALRTALPPSAPVRPAPARSAFAALITAARTGATRSGQTSLGASAAGPGDAVDAGRPRPAPVADGPVRSSPATRTFGPRPPGPDDADRRGGRVRLMAAAVAVVSALGAIGFGVRAASDGGRAPPEAVVARPEPSDRPCPDLDPAPVPTGAEVLEADVMGTGCVVPLVWDGRVLAVRLDPSDLVPRSYELVPGRGGPGQLVVGDWDCDRTQTPGYYQPGTGVVSSFDALPDRVGSELSGRSWDSGVVGGRARVVEGPDGCDVVEVSPRA